MKEASRELITGMLMGVLISLMLALVAFFCIKWRCRYLLLLEDNPRRASTIPIRTNGVDASVILSDSTVGQESPVVPQANCTSVWLDGTCKKNPASLLPGIPKYTYRYFHLLIHLLSFRFFNKSECDAFRSVDWFTEHHLQVNILNV